MMENNYQRRTPIHAKGGIRSQMPRIRNSHKWWTRSFINYIEALQIGPRIGRGRAYALSGQVLSLDIKEGIVKSNVQGGNAIPYNVAIRFDTIPKEEKAILIKEIKEDIFFLSQIVVGNLPSRLDTIFRSHKISLPPTDIYPIKCTCTCPDNNQFCKHICACIILLIEAIDQNPKHLLTLRGVTFDDLLGKKTVDEISEETQQFSMPQTESFWGESIPIPEPIHVEKGDGSLLIKRLGSIPFWRSEERFQDAMDVCAHRIAMANLLSNERENKNEKNRTNHITNSLS